MPDLQRPCAAGAKLACATSGPKPPSTVAEVMLRAIVEQAPLAIIVVDRQGTVTAWNPSAERLFGWSAAEVLGQRNPTIRDDEWSIFERLLADASQGDIPHMADGLRRRKDGSDVLVSAARAVMRDAHGKFIGLVGMLMDISDRDHAARAIAESEERYRSVVTGLEEGITLHDAKGCILATNPSAAQILGMPTADLVGRSLFDDSFRFVDDNALPLPEMAHPLAQALHTGRSNVGVVLGMNTVSGQRRWLKMGASPIASGGEARAVCAFSDVTIARYEELSRRQSEQNFRALIEISPDAVAVYQHGILVYANPRMLSLLGYQHASEVLGLALLDFVCLDDRPVVAEQLLNHASARHELPLGEKRFLRKDGSMVPAEALSLSIFYDGAPAMLVHARDLTEHKRLEAQLVTADRLASVGRLAVTVGHEINNPLAFILTNLQIALSRLQELAGQQGVDEVIDMLRDAREGAERVRHIVRDLKVFSRGNSEERVRVDPRRVLDSCANMAQGEIRTRTRLVKHYDPETPCVYVNEARLGQVLLNLLVNAAHAIPENAAFDHEITLTTRADASGRVMLEVRDTGVGIPDEVMPHIFEPFFTTKTGGAGTGLGLSICQNIVTALGGEIAVESQVGRGTSFRVFLPAAFRRDGSSSLQV